MRPLHNIFLIGCLSTCCHWLLPWILLEKPTAVSVWECVCTQISVFFSVPLPPPFLTYSWLSVWSKPACPLTGMNGCAIKAQTWSNPISSFPEEGQKEPSWRVFLVWIFACEIFQTMLIPPFQTAESYFSHTERWDQEEPRNSFSLHSLLLLFFFFFYLSCIAALSQNLPKSFSQATSVISAEPTQHPQSILLIVLPQMPLFWIIIHGSHSLCMASRQMTHLSRIPWAQ